jgi:FkbM family methyltransferase
MQPFLAERIRRSRVRPLKYLLRRVLRPKTVNIGGVRMIADPSRIGFRAVKSLYHGDYEAPERLIVSEAVKPGDKVLEAGAGMGLISLTLARIVGVANVVSYEPMPAAYSLLADNARLNGLTIDHRPRALAANGGSVKFYADGNVVASSLYSRSNTNLIEVEADGIAETLQAEGSNVLVLDIEGAEVELIKACPLSGIGKIVMEVHPHIVGEEATNAMIAQLKAAGFHADPALAACRVVTFLR